MKLSSFAHAFIGVAVSANFIGYTFASEDGDHLFVQGQYKEAILFYQEQLKNAPLSSQGELYKKIAIASYKDQLQAEAFQAFLLSLDLAQRKSSPPVSDAEQKVYNQALKLYLDHSSLQAHETAIQIKKLCDPIFVEHPDYYLIGFLIASAEANLGHFQEFFNLFYQSYQFHPDHYLAYKTKAILHIKLFERAREDSERDSQREKIFQNTLKAIEKNPQDETLYKLMIVYAKEKDKGAAVSLYLNKIIYNNIIIPRADVAFYVQQAVMENEFALAQRFIDKAKEWYQYSKVINSAQQFLDQKKVN